MAATMKTSAVVFFLHCLLVSVNGDTPANCTYEDIQGKWIFSVGKGGQGRHESCGSFAGPFKSEVKVNLQYPDVAVDEFGNIGFWTVIYNQGFEVVIAERKFFAFSKYTQVGGNVTSYCHQLFPGWTHDALSRDWACYLGRKDDSPVVKSHTLPAEEPSLSSVLKFESGRFYNDKTFISKIHSVQKLWRATAYSKFEGWSHEDMLRLAGGRSSRVMGRPKPAPATKEILQAAAKLPKSFDWRNVEGVNYVSPVRNQEKCGSCYAFASMALNEARVRVMTNNTRQPVFSTQDVVDCSEYSQGCDGGFPYLVGGKYAEDFGLVLESDNPYTGKEQGKCGTPSSAKRHYATKYEYIGGYYGGCNEPLMRLALYENGPIAVSFEVLSDFMHYKGGIYHHTGLQRGFNPFELTNHVVLVVGYGVDDATDTPFWIVKNSWGTDWGEDGFFRIMRGNDECALESIAVQSTPIIPL